jgi:hypothetical protein
MNIQPSSAIISGRARRSIGVISLRIDIGKY